ncbi:efflux RND transporter periplasmic adaptor subunit [Azotosporobacter soli]|uniref:efflux RND transporter periplasmic adaptor subunit n=1 Tax=Azotosporobacter soli TaxID=3055040 RepID=UPI0031FF1AAD
MKPDKTEIPIPTKEFVLGRKAYYIMTSCLVLVCLFAAWQYKAIFEKGRVQDRLIVKTQTVGPAGDATAYAFSGVVRGRYEIPMSFSASGRVSEILADVGSAVKNGDVLMRLAVTVTQEAAGTSSGVGVEAAQAEVAKAEANLNTFGQLYKQGAISRVMFERYQAAYDAAMANLQQARQAGGTVTRSSAPVAPGVLKTDYAGMVIGLDAKLGDSVSAGQRVLTLVREGSGAKEIAIVVPEEQLEGFRKMETIKVSFEALPGVSVEARLRDATSAVSQDGANVANVRLTLINPPPEVKYGMTAAVTAGGVGSVKPEVIVPLTAVIQRDALPAVWVVVDHAAVARVVKLRSRDAENVQIVDGLQPGDVVVVSGVQTLWDGKQVE